MVDRIRFDSSGVRVSRPGYDVNTAGPAGLGMFPGMGVMAQVLTGTVTLGAGGAQDFPLSNPSGKLPYITLNAGSEFPDRETFCAEVKPPYNYVRIRNISGPTRTIKFAALIDNS